jgi:hypothetical protein
MRQHVPAQAVAGLHSVPDRAFLPSFFFKTAMAQHTLTHWPTRTVVFPAHRRARTRLKWRPQADRHLQPVRHTRLLFWLQMMMWRCNLTVFVACCWQADGMRLETWGTCACGMLRIGLSDRCSCPSNASYVHIKAEIPPQSLYHDALQVVQLQRLSIF